MVKTRKQQKFTAILKTWIYEQFNARIWKDSMLTIRQKDWGKTKLFKFHVMKCLTVTPVKQNHLGKKKILYVLPLSVSSEYKIDLNPHQLSPFPWPFLHHFIAPLTYYIFSYLFTSIFLLLFSPIRAGVFDVLVTLHPQLLHFLARSKLCGSGPNRK